LNLGPINFELIHEKGYLEKLRDTLPRQSRRVLDWQHSHSTNLNVNLPVLSKLCWKQPCKRVWRIPNWIVSGTNCKKSADAVAKSRRSGRSGQEKLVCK